MRIIYFRHNKYIDMKAIQSRVMGFNEVTFVLDGTLTYYVNRKKVTVSGGDVICLKEGDERKRDSVKGADYFSFNFVDAEPNLPCKMEQSLDDTLRHLLCACESVYAENYDLTSQRLNVIFSAVLMQVTRNAKAVSESPAATMIKRYVSANLDKKILLKDVAHHVGYSEVYTDTVFKRQTGQSVIEYVTQEKIKKAKDLLVEGNMTLCAVGDACGFSDYNYFSKTFKKLTGYTPTQYKKITLN